MCWAYILELTRASGAPNMGDLETIEMREGPFRLPPHPHPRVGLRPHDWRSLACLVFVRTQITTGSLLGFPTGPPGRRQSICECRSVECLRSFPMGVEATVSWLGMGGALIHSPGCAALKPPRELTGDLIFGCHRGCKAGRLQSVPLCQKEVNPQMPHTALHRHYALHSFKGFSLR